MRMCVPEVSIKGRGMQLHPTDIVGLLVPAKSSNSVVTWGHFYWHGLTLISAWISNHLSGKVWDDITYPFLNFNGCTVEV